MSSTAPITLTEIGGTTLTAIAAIAIALTATITLITLMLIAMSLLILAVIVPGVGMAAHLGIPIIPSGEAVSGDLLP